MAIDRDAAYEAAQNELAKAIYPKASPIERLFELIDEWFYRLILKGSTFPGGWFTISVLLILLIAAVVVAIRIARRTMRTNRGADYPLFGAGELSAAQHRETAESYAAKGDWAAAIRHRLRAIARQLEEDAVLNPVPGRTANELARDAGQQFAELTPQLIAAANAFNDVTYGERLGTEAGYRMVAALDDQLQARQFTAATTSTSVGALQTWAGIQ